MNITASLQEKRGIYQVVLSYKDNANKRKQKWISTGILVKGNNKRLANKKLCGNSYITKYEDYICVDFTGKLFRPEYITDHFRLLLKNNNLRHIRFHDLRHSCASLLLSKGVPMKAIQEWLGHSTYSTTANFYTHLENNYKTESANALSNVLKF